MANVRATPSATPTPATPMSNGAVGATAIGDPGPLGLLALALTTFVFGLVYAGILSGAGDVKVVLGLALVYGGLAQVLAAMWEYRAGNTFGATAFGSFGAFWLSYAVLLAPALGVGLGAAAGPGRLAMGWYFIAWAIVAGTLALGAFRISGALSAVCVLLFLTFLLLGLGDLAGNKLLTQIGGWLGVLTAIAAWYTALAGILRGVSRGRIVLPIYPLS